MSIVLDGTSGITTPQVTTDDGEAYAPGNILGTVSQSGGVPTGAIIERGSNANGEYVKYADGTMICRTTMPTIDFGTATTEFSATWPAVFSEVPIQSYNAISTGNSVRAQAYGSMYNVPTTTSARLGVGFTFAGTATGFVAVGVGRWF